MESGIRRWYAGYRGKTKMIATPEQNKRLREMCKEVKEMFPDFYGSVRFNLNPKDKRFNINIVENIIE